MLRAILFIYFNIKKAFYEKKLLLIFLVVVAILFVTINIRDTMQRPFHRERVNNFITAAKDLIQKNEQLEITEIGEGGRMKGGG